MTVIHVNILTWYLCCRFDAALCRCQWTPSNRHLCWQELLSAYWRERHQWSLPQMGQLVGSPGYIPLDAPHLLKCCDNRGTSSISSLYVYVIGLCICLASRWCRQTAQSKAETAGGSAQIQPHNTRSRQSYYKEGTAKVNNFIKNFHSFWALSLTHTCVHMHSQSLKWLWIWNKSYFMYWHTLQSNSLSTFVSDTRTIYIPFKPRKIQLVFLGC